MRLLWLAFIYMFDYVVQQHINFLNLHPTQTNRKHGRIQHQNPAYNNNNQEPN